MPSSFAFLFTIRYRIILRYAILLLAVLLPAATSAFAQASSQARTSASANVEQASGAVIIVRQVGHARAALQTAESLRTRARFGDAPIEIVVCGQGSEHLVRSSPDAADLVAEARRLDVRLFACGLSLGNLGIDPADLAEGVGVVPNGLLHALERQADGYLSVEL